MNQSIKCVKSIFCLIYNSYCHIFGIGWLESLRGAQKLPKTCFQRRAEIVKRFRVFPLSYMAYRISCNLSWKWFSDSGVPYFMSCSQAVMIDFRMFTHPINLLNLRTMSKTRLHTKCKSCKRRKGNYSAGFSTHLFAPTSMCNTWMNWNEHN